MMTKLIDYIKSIQDILLIVIWLVLASTVLTTIVKSDYDKAFLITFAMLAWVGGVVSTKLVGILARRRHE